MIPVKLNIRNFLSYRENVPALDFTGLHVACLCGDNGHGKSALLDAITWCLWGQARGQVQDDLVSYGADDARVELEFLARDGRFRAIRSRRRGGGRRRQGATDLQLLAVADDGIASQVVSGNSVRETQARIEQLVGMEYETFINSAFLLQGRADEFTNKTPAERKALLASILGLEAYDRFQARARERLAESRSNADRLSGRVLQMQADLAAIGDPAVELAAINRQLADLEAGLEPLRRDVQDLKNSLFLLRQQESEVGERRSRRAQVTGEMARIQAEIAAVELRVKDHEGVIASAPDIEAGALRLVAAQDLFARMESTRQEFDLLSREQGELSRGIEVERTRLETEARQLRRRADEDLSPLAASEATLGASLQESQQRLKEMKSAESGMAELRSRIQALATGVGEAQSLAARYQAEGEQIKEKLGLLNSADPNSVVCPLCLSPLSEDGCSRLAQNYDVEIAEKRELYRANRSNLQTLEKEKGDLEQELGKRERAQVEESNRLRDQIARAETQLMAARAAREELTTVEAALGAVVARLSEADFARPERSRLEAVEQELKGLAYDETAYRETVETVRKLQPFGELKVRLEASQRQLALDKNARRQSSELLERLTVDVEGLDRLIAEAEVSIAELPRVESRLAQAAQAIEDMEHQQRAALSSKGLLEGRLEQARNLGNDIERAQGEQKRAQEAQGIYQELAAAFGRQGIQAMLIETVVPRLEEETNALLGRMTDNRMHVKLETQRERRSGSGEPIETLEINVSDELGSRSYEMYSGGEAFRVNLALRIALSRVLSQRTGAPLPTLFIDEGFGTQDASGRERILDVISAIEDDFDKIIVITHLDDLKDMFPVRIEVQKDANGSTFWLS
ncbi:MAG: SMC family ATPase [Chloroflexi bacterium]|nr:SMC family ATPase [Chloroflexota bacterium]